MKSSTATLRCHEWNHFSLFSCLRAPDETCETNKRLPLFHFVFSPPCQCAPLVAEYLSLGSFRLFPPSSLTFITCGCDAERISGAPSGDAQCPCVFRGGISCRQEGSGEEERKKRQQTDHSFTAAAPLRDTCTKNTVLLIIFSPRLKVSNMCRI